MKHLIRLAVALSIAGATPPLCCAQQHLPSFTQVVTAIQIPQSGIVLSSSPNPSYLDQGVVFVCTVRSTAGPSEPTGSVTFTSGGVSFGTVPLASGVATITAANLPAGTDVVVGEYSGDNVYAPGSSNIVDQVVLSVPLTLTMTPTSVTLNPGQSQVFQVTADRSLGLQLSAAAVPAGVSLSLGPAVVNTSGGLASSTTSWTATLATNEFLSSNGSTPGRRGRVDRGGEAGMALLAMLCLPFVCVRRRQKCVRLAAVFFGLFGCMVLSGCGTTGWYGHNPSTFSVTVTAVSSIDGATASATSTVTVQ